MQVSPASHWPELEVLILVVSSEKKAVSSTRGMQATVQTSPLMKVCSATSILYGRYGRLCLIPMFQYRCERVVPQRMVDMERAIVERDFETFARLTMQESNQFHAVCLDSYPPILYLNDTSKRVMQLITSYNELHQRERVQHSLSLSAYSLPHLQVAYTFDAGPNAVLYCLRDQVQDLLSLTTHYFPPTPQNER